MDKKLKKVELYYDDGTIGYIEGKELEKWVDASAACEGLMYSHGGKTGYEDIKWKTRKEIGFDLPVDYFENDEYLVDESKER